MKKPRVVDRVDWNGKFGIEELFPARLKEAMERKGMRQSHLARAVGVSYAGICEYMNGNRFPRINGLFALASILDVPPAWLLGIDGFDDEEAAQAFARLDEKDRARATGYMQSLLEQDKYKEE